MTIYFLSGLGADSRAFKYLKFPSEAELIFIDWLIPGKTDKLEDYAMRIAQKIDTSKDFYLVGLSFGGILAMEVLNYVQPKKTIIISSAACRQELPVLFRIAGKLRLHKLLPSRLVNRPNWVTYWLFGVKTEKEKKLLTEIITSSNTKFSKWAVGAILTWSRKAIPKNVIRICGDSDRVLPAPKENCNYLIRNGGHFMVATQARKISEILKKELGGV